MAIGAAGCAVGPDYQRPDLPAAKQQGFRGQAADPKALGDVPFWEVFHDEALKGLIQEALSKSPNVQIAAARVEQARALARGGGGARAPSLPPNAGGMRQRASVPGVGVATGDVFAPGISASWEVDLWGRL